MKLNIGSGNVHIEGYLSVDPYAPADLCTEATSLPMGDGEVEEIYSSHMLEHLSFDEAAAALLEWRRVLKPGGKITIVVPNLNFVAAAWLHGGDRSYRRQMLFGNQQHEGEFHKNGWTEQDLRDDLCTAGFVVGDSLVRYTPEYSQESIIVEATR